MRVIKKLLFLTYYKLLFLTNSVQTIYICFSRLPCKYFCILFLRTISMIQNQVSPGKKRTLTTLIEIGLFFSIFFPRLGTRNTFPLLYIRKYTLSRSGNPIGHQAGPDGQTRLGRVNQRAGDLNQ